MPKLLDRTALAEAVRRCAAGESQHKVARGLGIAQATISRHLRARQQEAAQ